MFRRLVPIAVLIVVGCGDSGPDYGIPDDWGCNLPEPPNPSRCGPTPCDDDLDCDEGMRCEPTVGYCRRDAAN